MFHMAKKQSPIALNMKVGADCAASDLLALARAVDARLLKPDGLASDPAAINELRRRAFDLIAAIVPSRSTNDQRQAACFVINTLASSGCLLKPIADGVVSQAIEVAKKGWPGLLAALAVVPAWYLPVLPAIDELPHELWPTYIRCRLLLPSSFVRVGETDACFSAYLSCIRELVKLAEINRWAAAVRAALAEYSRAPSSTLFIHTVASLGELAALRGRLMNLTCAKGGGEETLLLPRDGRRLRIGFILPSCELTKHSRLARVLARGLDGTRFEVIFYALSSVDSTTTLDFQNDGIALQGIETDLSDALAQMRGGMLDVAVLMTNVMNQADKIAQLVLLQVAPMQVVFDATCCSPDLSGADLAVEAVETVPSKEKVRRVCLPYWGSCPVVASFEPEGTHEWTRESLGLPEKAVLFASIAPFRSMTPEWVTICCRILLKCDDSRMLLYSPDSADLDPSIFDPFCGMVSGCLDEYGVDPSRVIISNEQFPSTADLSALIKIADCFLNPGPRGAVEGAVLALEENIPVVTLKSAAVGTALTEILSHPELVDLVVSDLEQYFTVATRLGLDAASRMEVRTRLGSTMQLWENVLDPTVASAVFAKFIELVFDQLNEKGRDAFRVEKRPLILDRANDESIDFPLINQEMHLLFETGVPELAAERVTELLVAYPGNQEVRRLFYRLLELQRRWKALSESLIATVTRIGNDPTLWHLLAKALLAGGNAKDGAHALEVSLRLDPTNLDAWRMLSRLAEQGGDAQMQADIASIIHEMEASGGSIKSVDLQQD